MKKSVSGGDKKCVTSDGLIVRITSDARTRSLRSADRGVYRQRVAKNINNRAMRFGSPF